MFKFLLDIILKIPSKYFYKNRDCTAAFDVHHTKPEIPLPEYSGINPYPCQYEKKVVTRTGLEVFIRPIKPDDRQLLLDLFNFLSRETRYYRFFSPIKALPHEMLIRFTQVDYCRDMAFVATDIAETKERILAVARFMSKPDQRDAEFAVVVRDEFQGKGVGRVLLENLITVAKEKKIESMSGFVLAENTHMLSLVRRMGFSITRIPEDNMYFIKIDLCSI